MNTLAHWGGSVLVVCVYAYILGTAIWLCFVAPGMYKRQWQMLKRIDALERQIAGMASQRPL